jgi:transcriptional regulator with XRE-family HTH domain
MLYGWRMTTDDDDQQVWERNFRERMIRLRESRDMTQTDLARALHNDYGLPFHQQTIARIETGERPIRLNEANLIAQTFGVQLSMMMSDTESATLNMQLLKRRIAETTVYLDDRTEELQRVFGELEKAWRAYASAQDDRGMTVEKLIDKGLMWTLGRFEEQFAHARDVLASVIELSEV